MTSTKKVVDSVKKIKRWVNLFRKKIGFRLLKSLDFKLCIGKNAVFNFLFLFAGKIIV